jgi:hypothetical protein
VKSLDLKKIWSSTQHFYWKRIATDWSRATHNLRSTDRLYSRLIAQADAKRDREGSDSLHAEWRADREPDQDEVDRLTTIYWEKRAQKDHIPIPDYGQPPNWEKSEVKQVYRLTTTGIDFIENRVLEKRKRRWETWLMAIPALTGLIGTLTALVLALWHRSN